MTSHVSRITTAGLTVLCAGAIGASLLAAAQGRFELLGGDAIAAVQGV